MENIEALKHEIEQTRKHLDAVKENIADWETKLAEDMQRLEELKSKQPWRFVKGQKAWFINGLLEVNQEEINCDIDINSGKIGLVCRSENEAYARLQFLQLLTKNNLWDRVQQEVTLRLELEEWSKGRGWRYRFFLETLYDTFGTNAQGIIKEKFGNRLNILFQPLTPQADV